MPNRKHPGAVCAALLWLMTCAGAGAQVINISTNGEVTDFGLRAGFIIRGTEPTRVVILGERLSGSNIDAVLRLTDITGGRIFASNDSWRETADAAQIQALIGRTPNVASDAAIVITLDPGVYVATLTSSGASGRGLVSINDGDNFNGAGRSTTLINLSTNGFVDQAGMLAGFIVTGTLPKRVVVTGEAFASGIDPVVRVQTIGGDLIAQNDDWIGDKASALEVTSALGRDLNDRLAAGLAVTLQPGVYIAALSSFNDTVGNGIVSVNDFLESNSLVVRHGTARMFPARDLDGNVWRWFRRMVVTNTSGVDLEVVAIGFDTACEQSPGACQFNNGKPDWVDVIDDYDDCFANGRMVLRPGQACQNNGVWFSTLDSADSAITVQPVVWFRAPDGRQLRAFSDRLTGLACPDGDVDINISPNPTPGARNEARGRWEWRFDTIDVSNRSPGPISVFTWEWCSIPGVCRETAASFDGFFDAGSARSTIGPGATATAADSFYFNTASDSYVDDFFVWYRTSGGNTCGAYRRWEQQTARGVVTDPGDDDDGKQTQCDDTQCQR